MDSYTLKFSIIRGFQILTSLKKGIRIQKCIMKGSFFLIQKEFAVVTQLLQISETFIFPVSQFLRSDRRSQTKCRDH